NQESRLPPGSDFRRWVWITIAPFVTWYTRFGKGILSWLGGGVSGLLATAISTLLIVGAVSLFTPSVRDTARDSLKGVVDTLIPETPIPGVTETVKTNKQTQP
ncbi:hypothetical protein NSP18_16020, partial [Salmonella enterica]|nr:hypothetical protein [Salmonella enterica]